ncbi:MAG TPA: tetratricopeptide repeat protein, partial [Polyangiaceae bacterium]
TEYAEQIERVAGTNQQIWGEVLSACAQALGNEQLSLEVRNQLMLRVGRWYLEKVVRPDLALPCFHSVIAADPANGEALSGLAHIYRRAQQWKELVGILSRWADAAKTPAHARDLRAESADLMAQRLNDVNGARDLYERIVQEDPGHASACEALGKIYQSTRNVEGYAKLLERRAEALRGEEKLRVLCQLGEVYEDHLKDDSEAVRCYRRALSIEPKHLDALRALDRVYSRTARYQDLLENIRAQIEVAATPRQKIALFERIAGIYDEEFLDHQQAAQAWEEVLRFDSAHQPALTALIRHYRALDRWEEVGSVYARLLKLVTDPGHRVELAIACGRVFAEQLNSPERAEAAYEMVLQVDPEHGGALEALARLRETAGDADAALKAIEALAVRAATPEAKAEQLVRAAKLFEARRDLDSAIERYKRALDASPKQLSIATALREAYVARGDINAAVKLIGWEIDQTEGDRAKGKLAGEMAVLLYSRLQDAKRAEEAGRRAVALDPTNVGGRTVLGDVSFDAQKFLEAAVNYEVVADRADSLPKEEATRVLVRYVDALSQSGSSDKALAPVATLLRIAPEDIKALEHVARVTYEHGAPKRAAELYKELLARASSLSDSDRGVALYRRGESLRRSGDAKDAIEPLEEASDLDPSSAEPLISLAKAFEELGRWDQVVKVKNRHMDLAQGETRVQLLMEIGDIYASKLKDRTQATKSYVIALDERPEDRRLLAKLMQLYSEEKDWNRLIEVVVRLASFVEDPVQKVKYLHTAANLSAKQMNDPERAMDFYNQVLELDPDMDRALTEAIELEQGRNNHAGVEKLLQRQIELAKRRTDEKLQLSTFTALGQLYEKLGSTDKAIDAYEAAQALDADNRERALQLSEIYASDPTRYLDKAVASQALILRQNPYRRESYKMLRRLYTETKRADAAWCLCQALHVLKLADPDEERFYTRMRADTSAEAQDVMN